MMASKLKIGQVFWYRVNNAVSVNQVRLEASGDTKDFGEGTSTSQSRGPLSKVYLYKMIPLNSPNHYTLLRSVFCDEFLAIYRTLYHLDTLYI